MAEILPITPTSIAMATGLLLDNQVIGVPTETVYGLAGNAFSHEAIIKIFSTKNRPDFDPLIVHIPTQWNSLERLHELGIVDITKLASHLTNNFEPSDLRIQKTSELMKKHWPGPLTLILPRGPRIPELVTSGLDCVGIRMPAHEGFQQLLNSLDFPLAAPSANLFGRISPTQARHVQEDLGLLIPLILDGGSCGLGIESTVLDCTHPEGFLLLRPGGLPAEDLEHTLSLPKGALTPVTSDKAQMKKSPGHLLSHYAPKKPLYLLKSRLIDFDQECLFMLTEWLRQQDLKVAFAPLMPLPDHLMQDLAIWEYVVYTQAYSTKGELSEIAQNLFQTLRELDASDADFLISESMIRLDGLAPAIQDRLARAAFQILDFEAGQPVRTPS